MLTSLIVGACKVSECPGAVGCSALVCACIVDSRYSYVPMYGRYSRYPEFSVSESQIKSYEGK